jgi:hypothetical protein
MRVYDRRLLRRIVQFRPEDPPLPTHSDICDVGFRGCAALDQVDCRARKGALALCLEGGGMADISLASDSPKTTGSGT